MRKQLAENGHAYVRVTGNSMMPLLKHLRDGVIIIPPDLIRIGDIVLFDRANGRYALHRVIQKKKNGFTMAGDNQWYIETGLPYNQVIGVVDALMRNGREISRGNFFLTIYSFVVTQLTFPRIYIWKAIVRLEKLLHHSENNDRKGVDE